MLNSFFNTTHTTHTTQHTASPNQIDLRNVVKEYRTGDGVFHALKGVNLTIASGEFVAIVGKSGSGKSTLVNMMTGIDRPSRGEVLVCDTPVHKLSEGKAAKWRGKTIGVIFQFFQLLPTLNLLENVMLPMDFCNVHAEREREGRAMQLLETVDLADHAHKLPSACSGGQQQRAAIARALANDPPILIADEPTGNLDSKTANQIFTLFHQLVAMGRTILMVTHDADLAQRVPRAILVADGEIVKELRVTGFSGPPTAADVLPAPDSLSIAQPQTARPSWRSVIYRHQPNTPSNPQRWQRPAK